MHLHRRAADRDHEHALADDLVVNVTGRAINVRIVFSRASADDVGQAGHDIAADVGAQDSLAPDNAQRSLFRGAIPMAR